MSEYAFSIENGAENLQEMFPLYAEQYRQMKARLEAEGHRVPEFNPRIDEYVKAWLAGHLINYVVRFDGTAVGYSNIYLTNDMHNGEFIAKEDTIFVVPEHRNGTGRRFSKFILQHLKSRGVKKLHVTALTDLRVEKLWKRMGFKPIASAMIYNF